MGRGKNQPKTIISWGEVHSSIGSLVTGGGWGGEWGEVPQYKINNNSLNFWARSPKFCMEVCMDSPNKLRKYKIRKKYINTKVQ